MFAFHEASTAKAVRLACFSVLMAISALQVAGCAETKGAANAPDVAMNVDPRVEMEPDGLPSQPPPVRRLRDLPDDPNEPFSPNYGGPNPAALVPAPRAVSDANPATAPYDVRRRVADASQ